VTHQRADRASAQHGRRRWLVLAIGVALAWGLASAQDRNPSGENTRALALLGAGSYRDAITVYSALLTGHPADLGRDEWLYNRARAFYHLDGLSQAADDLETLLNEYPASPLRPFAHRYVGACYAREGRYLTAAREYLRAWALSESPNLDSVVVASLSALIDVTVHLADITPAISELPKARLRELTRRMAPELTRARRFDAAIDLALTLGDSITAEHVRLTARGNPGPIAIALVVPLSGSRIEEGIRIARAARAALDQ